MILVEKLRIPILLITGAIEIILNVMVIKTAQNSIIVLTPYIILSGWVLLGKTLAGKLDSKIVTPVMNTTNQYMINIYNNRKANMLETNIGNNQSHNAKLSFMLDRGIRLYKNGNVTNATKLFTKGLEYARRTRDVEYSIVNMVNLALSKLKAKEYLQSIELLEGVITESTNGDFPLMSAKSHYLLAYIYWELNKLDEALNQAVAALAIYTDLEYLYGVALAQDYIASIKFAKNNVEESLADFTEILSNAIRCGDILLQARAYAYIGVIQRTKGNVDCAIQSHEKAAKLLTDFEKTETVDYLGVIGELACDYTAVERYEDALTKFTDIIRVCLDKKYNQMLGKLFASVASLYGNQARTDIALDYIKRAEPYFLEYESNDQNYVLHASAVYLFLLKRNHTDALERVNTALEYAKKSEKKKYLAEAYFMKGYILALLGIENNGIAALMDLATRVFQDIGDVIGQSDAQVNGAVARLLNNEEEQPLYSIIEEALVTYQENGQVIQYTRAMNLYLKVLINFRSREAFIEVYNRLSSYIVTLDADSLERQEAQMQLAEIDNIMETIRENTVIPIQLLILAKLIRL